VAHVVRRAYYAATTGMDEEIGKLLQGLKDAGVEGECTMPASVWCYNTDGYTARM
jgi:hypothetical protein